MFAVLWIFFYFVFWDDRWFCRVFCMSSSCWFFVAGACTSLRTVSSPFYTNFVVISSIPFCLLCFVFIHLIYSTSSFILRKAWHLILGIVYGQLCENRWIIMCADSCSECSFHRYCMLASSRSILPFASFIDGTLSSNFPLRSFTSSYTSCILFISKASSAPLHCCSNQLFLSIFMQFLPDFSTEPIELL